MTGGGAGPRSPDEVAAEVRRIEIATRHLVRDIVAGEYSSAFRGRGVEFAEVREYQPGDDVRSIDWNVTARLGTTYVKRFLEERELTVVFAVDASASLGFGSRVRSKARLAAEVAAVLALAAAANNDRVGALFFTDGPERFVPPGKGRRHALRVISELLSFAPRSPGTDLRAALEHLAALLRRRTVVFLVSDFLAADYHGPLERLARRHDVVALGLRDPRERELPAAGLVALREPESGRVRWVDTDSARVRERFAARAAELDRALEEELRRRGVELIRLETDRSYAEPLLAFFRRRERELGR
ncbi:MAG TPA: DUF58 domain-containing protein [Gemmatimonadales bacterium]|nr:DUF58 domain-containing protein [Gemmatimonadales bacterium]